MIRKDLASTVRPLGPSRTIHRVARVYICVPQYTTLCIYLARRCIVGIPPKSTNHSY
jgi:hypothetical protein